MISSLLPLISIIIFWIVIAKFTGKSDTKEEAYSIFKIVAKVLNSKIKVARFFGPNLTAKGLYKGREIKFVWGSSEGPDMYRVEIVHRGLPFKKLCLIRVPRPTEKTQLENNRICYGYGIRNIKTEQDLINIFEELTKAAIIVEQNKPYYAQPV